MFSLNLSFFRVAFLVFVMMSQSVSSSEEMNDIVEKFCLAQENKSVNDLVSFLDVFSGIHPLLKEEFASGLNYISVLLRIQDCVQNSNVQWPKINSDWTTWKSRMDDLSETIENVRKDVGLTIDGVPFLNVTEDGCREIAENLDSVLSGDVKVILHDFETRDRQQRRVDIALHMSGQVMIGLFLSHSCSNKYNYSEDWSNKQWVLTLKYSRTVKDYVQGNQDRPRKIDRLLTSLLIRAIRDQQRENQRMKSRT